MSESDTLLDAALRYASAGIAVFPTRIGVRGDGKKDVRPIASWKEASTTDPDVIRSWFGQGGGWEGAALCIDCGKSGIVGIDQDITEGKNGIVEWEKLEPAPTWRVRSGSGGAHDYYRADPENPVSVDNTGAVAPGVDVRGQGGFLFAPPSIDPRGGSWEWVAGEPDWSALPAVPAVVAQRLAAKPSAVKKKREGEEGAPPSVVTGEVVAWSGGGIADLIATGRREPPASFGPGGGYKTKADARALLSREHQAFLALAEEGSERSHILSQRYGVLAGRGVGVFWEYEWALDVLMSACRENGFAAANGEAYARSQAVRGLEHGMREPWIAIPEPTEALSTAIEATPVDAVDALIAKMLSPDDVVSRPAPKFLVHGLLQFDSESWIIGPPGSKKSFVVLDMAARVIRGEAWQGRRTNPADVVMIVAEGAGGVGKRIDAWQRRYGKIGDGLYILPEPVQAGRVEAWAVLVGACAKLGQRAAERGRGLLVILDTQARVTVGLKENDATDMGVFISAVSAIRSATGACVLTVHHTGRQGQDARGSSAIDGAQTTELAIAPTKGSKLTAKLKTTKQKDIEEIEPVDLAFEVVDVGQDEDGMALTSLVLCEQGSAAFRLAWADGEVTEENADTEEQAKITPLNYRTSIDSWIVVRSPAAKWHHRIVQVIVDTAETLGLTQSEVRKAVKEKYGDTDGKTWLRAWQAVTNESGQWADVVVSAGGQRWTRDPVRVAELLSSD